MYGSVLLSMYLLSFKDVRSKMAILNRIPPSLYGQLIEECCQETADLRISFEQILDKCDQLDDEMEYPIVLPNDRPLDSIPYSNVFQF